MDYTVLARRFRPQAFGEVVGQEMVAQALRNAIAGDRVAHAYLFTGARGVGKTSMARILAKSLNCPQAQDGNPCNACDVCHSISAGNDVDVIEIDGASNRGIEDIRSLRANVNVKPMRCQYKIYIIDEVHMLTREAFNALLKTLEEPPPNVKFLFCTTEAQKLPDTILSRCQRFDFSTIATDSIIERLRQIAEAEGFQAEPAALQLVARKAAGSMRDSQSLFDQLLAFGGTTLTAADVQRLLGVASDDRLSELADAIIQRQQGLVLELFDAALSEGVQAGELVDQLLTCFRDLMVLAAGAADLTLMSVSEEQRPVLARQAAAWGLQNCLAALQILAEAKARMRGVSYGRVLAELALVRIATLEDLDALGQVIQQLKSGKIPALAAISVPAPTGGAVPPSSPAISAPRARLDEGARASDRLPEPPGMPPDGAQKKNDGDDAGSSISSSVSVVEASALIPLESGREHDILTQMVSNLTDVTKSYAKNIHSLAISGPNQVVLSIPKRYHLSKTFLDRPDPLGRLEKTIAGIVGKSVRLLIVLDETTPEAAPSHLAEQRPQVNPRPSESNQDSFLNKVISVFEAKIIQ